MANNFFGESSGFLKDELTGTIESGGMNEFLSQMLMSGKKQIGRGARRVRKGMEESANITGFSGTNVNASTDLFEAEAGQIADLKTGVAGIAEQSRAGAVGQLIGVNQFEGGQAFNKAQLEEQMRQFDVTTNEGRRQFEKMFGLKERELDAMLDAQGGDFLSVIGNILGTGAGIATGGVFGGVASGLGNIFEEFFA